MPARPRRVPSTRPRRGGTRHAAGRCSSPRGRRRSRRAGARRASSRRSPGGAWPTSFSGPALTAGQWSRPHAYPSPRRSTSACIRAATSSSLRPGRSPCVDHAEDLLRLADRAANPLDLGRRLAAAERVDDRLRRREAVDERRVREGLLQHPPEAVRQAVGRRVAIRVVERDRARREALDGLDERRPDALVVADDLVGADLLDARRVEAPDDRGSLAVAEMRNAPVHALYVPAMSSRHGSFVSSVSRTSVSQRSTSCSPRIATAWSTFSWTRLPSATAIAADATCSRPSRPRSSRP